MIVIKQNWEREYAKQRIITEISKLNIQNKPFGKTVKYASFEIHCMGSLIEKTHAALPRGFISQKCTMAIPRIQTENLKT